MKVGKLYRSISNHKVILLILEIRFENEYVFVKYLFNSKINYGVINHVEWEQLN